MKNPFLSDTQVFRSRVKKKIALTSGPENCCNSNRPDPLSRLNKPQNGNKGIQVHATKQERALVEAIVLQAAEDMWDSEHRNSSILFFAGEGFVTCARILWMGRPQKLRLLRFLKPALHRKAFSRVSLQV
jgi:hypothetical protein